MLPTQEFQAQATQQKQQLLTQALVEMLPLEKGVKLNMSTDEKRARMAL